MNVEYDLNYLCEKGFSEKFARYFINCISDEKLNPLYDADYGEWALSKGFLPGSAYAYGLDEHNFEKYLSDYDYYRIWPVNSWSRIWVDDKLTLKLILDGTEYSQAMPEYYFYSTRDGLKELSNNPYKGQQGIEALINVLIEKKEIACKPNNGTGSNGFFKISYEGNCFKINKEEVSRYEIRVFVNSHPNYIYTEYLHPEGYFNQINPLIHTLRLVTINVDGNNPRIIGGYLRFGTVNHGETNKMSRNEDSKSSFDFVSEVEISNGYMSNSKSVFFNRVISTPKHPDSGIIVEGAIPQWSELCSTILGISNRLFNVELMGYDIGITNNGFKIMEINTHPGIRYMQVFHSLYEDNWTREWFRRKIETKT